MKLFQQRASMVRAVNPNNLQEVDPVQLEFRALEDVRKKIQQALLERQDVLDKKDTEEGRQEIKIIIAKTFRNSDLPRSIKNNADYHIENIFNDICGYGPLQRLLEIPTVTEIIVNGPNNIRVEENGVEKSVPNLRFRDREHMIEIISRILAPIGRTVDSSNPIVDGFLPDKSRVNIVLDPTAITGPYISIRKFVKQLSIDELVARGTFGKKGNEIIPIFEATVRGHLNFIVGGGTGAGKTTLLNGIAKFIPPNQSIVTIEDVVELDLEHPNVRGLLTRPPNVEGKGEIKARQLLINALRMRPKRIIVGEVRDEVIDEALTAMNTGHEGSGFSIHTNSPQELPERVAYLSPRKEGILPGFAKAVHMIFQVNQLEDGRRRLTHIAQIGGYENNQVIIENLFEYNPKTDILERTNVPFRFKDKLDFRNVVIPPVLL